MFYEFTEDNIKAAINYAIENNNKIYVVKPDKTYYMSFAADAFMFFIVKNNLGKVKKIQHSDSVSTFYMEEK